MAKTYNVDLQSTVFPDQMVQFVDFAKSRGCTSPSDVAKLIYSEELYLTFPNVSIALRMFMCLMVSNCSGERSLTALELLSVESDLLDTISFDDIVDQFASVKSRKCL